MKTKGKKERETKGGGRKRGEESDGRMREERTG